MTAHYVVRLSVAPALLLALAAPTSFVSAGGDYTIGSITEGYVPDFDQVRSGASGLPNSGTQYCVPTATVDWMAYLANHGFPDAVPGGPNNWQAQEQYGLVTSAIATMGLLMGTDPTAGTVGGGTSGTIDWLDGTVGPDQFTVMAFFASGTFAPDVGILAGIGNLGALVLPNIGWYLEIEPGVWRRTGGHTVALTGAFANAEGSFTQNGAMIRFRDPASGGATTTQSFFSDAAYEVEYITGQFSSTNDNLDFFERRHARLIGMGSGDTCAFLHGFRAIFPMTGLTGGLGGLTALQPVQLDTTSFPVAETIPTANGNAVLDAALALGQTCYLYTTVDGAGVPDDTVWCCPRLGGAPFPVYTGDEARLVASGPDRVYVVDSNGEFYAQLETFPAMTGPVVPPGEIVAIGYDETSDSVLTWIPDLNQIVSRNKDLGSPFSFQLPTIKPDPYPGTKYMAVDPDNGDVWLTSDLADHVDRYFLLIDGGTAFKIDGFSDPGLVGAKGLEVTRSGGRINGNITVSGGGILKVYAQDEDGNWAERLDAPFSGLPGGSVVRLARTQTNIDAGELGDSAWHDVLPTMTNPPEYDCLGDLDASGDIGFPDLLALLAVWGPCKLCAADLDDDFDIDFADLLIILSGWGPCP